MGIDRRNTFIAGYYGFGNTGDEAILAALVEGLKISMDRVDITVASGAPTQTQVVHGVNAVSWNDIHALDRAITGADAVVIGGGGLFHDYWPFEPSDMLSRFHGGLAYLGSVAWLATLHEKPLVIRSVGVGPLTTELGRAHTRAIFEQAWGASVRDPGSMTVLEATGFDVSRCELGADPAFLLQPSSQKRARTLLEREGLEAGRPRIGVILRDWEFAGPPEGWLVQIAPVLQNWANTHDGEILMLPFQQGTEESTNDLRIAEILSDLLDPGVPRTILRARLHPADSMAILGSCRTNLAMRLHGVLFSAIGGTPVVGLGYDPKVEQAMRLLGIGELCLPLAELSSAALETLIDTTETKRTELLAAMARGVSKQRRACVADDELLPAALSGRLAPPPPPTGNTIELQRRAIVELALRADTTYSNNEAMVLERKTLLTIQHRLEGQKEMLEAERDQLAQQKQTLIEERNTELRRAEEELAAARAAIAALREENQRLAWKARGILGRAADRIFRPRPEGRFRYWSRSLYYAVAGLILKLSRSGRRAYRGAGAPTPLYAARFERYLSARTAICGTPGDRMVCPSEPGLVSIVLPVFNGGSLLEEALDSILAQTYADFELIAIDDGSTDGSAEILDRYAREDPRIRVVHQENQKLPRALSNGFRLARGQYLTWTSHDNRLKPNFLEKMVDCLQRHPDWDMVYANIDIIGDDGLFLIDSDWYAGYQHPRGSQHVHLPSVRGELNTWANNYVGAAFLYRDRVAALLGDYCADRFTVEDYDYWMQVNEFLELHHADFDDAVYEYRFHEHSLTTREDDSRILALRDRVMVFDDFRRDFALSSMVWILDGFPGEGHGAALAEDLRLRLGKAGHLEQALEDMDPTELPDLWFPTAYLHWTESPEGVHPPRDRLPRHALCVLVTPAGASLPEAMPEAWDLCVTIAPSSTLTRTETPYQGWYGLRDAAALFATANIRTRIQQFRAIEEETRRCKEPSPLDATVVISTYRRRHDLEQALRSIARQTTPMDRFEVLVVNNDPADHIGPLISEIRNELFADHPDHLRAIVCPLKGLSHARNAGIGAARGEIVAFIDDDAVAAPTWLESLLQAYRSNPELDVVGGRNLLATPDPAPDWLEPAAWSLWAYLNPPERRLHTVERWSDFPWGCNWSATRRILLEIGGFRYGYGRKGDDYGGGEEIVAASLAQKIGAVIAMEPGATIEHRPHWSRFTPEYVEKTIRAGTLVGYYLQRDLYIPQWQKPLDVLEFIGRRLLRMLAGRARSPFQRMEQRARLKADITLFRRMVADALYLARFSS